MMHRSRRIKITDINPHITCVLCSGYLIDATTIIECLHSFCRACIVKYLETNKYCPICDVQVHKTKPLLNIRSDQTLQDIVYKLVPGLFQNEMCRRRDFYAKHPESKPSSAEESGEVTQFSHIYTADESISLSLEYYNNNVPNDKDNNTTTVENKMQPHPSRRFLRCPAAVSVSNLQKLIRAKYGLSIEHRVDILYMNDRLSEDFTLMDIAYIYLWRRKGPLHLTYRIFEVAKKIKLENTNESSDVKTENAECGEAGVKNEWKEVQLQISENGIMSVTNIGETKLPENVAANLVDVKTEVDLRKPEIPELSPIQKPGEKLPETIKKEETVQQTSTDTETKLGKHKLQDVKDSSEPSAKIMKPNIPATTAAKSTPASVKNVQQLSKNHPLKIHSQTVTKNHVGTPVSNAKLIPQPKSLNQNTHVQCLNKTIENNNAVKTAISSVQSVTPITVQNNLPLVQTAPNLVTPKTTVQNVVQCPEKSTKMPQSGGSPSPISTGTTTILTPSSELQINSFPNMILPNSLQYTQAGLSTDNTTITSLKSGDNSSQNSIQKTPISSSCPVVISNNCIQSSKVSIVPKKSLVKVGPSMGYKTLRDPPKAWNPQISRQNLTKTNTFTSNNGASTSDVNKTDNKAPTKPAKFFKMRNNMPRYLGNPASGVKPMYQVREGDTSPPDAKKAMEAAKKPVVESKLNNNNKDDVKPKQETQLEVKKSEVKKQSIIKIDPKTLKPITNDTASSSDTPEMKINQSTVPIFNPLRTQKSQTSPKVDRRSPKSSSSYLDIQNPPKSPLDRNSPKSTPGKPLNSPTSKKDKLNINFTPPNPFIPNLASPNLAPNQFLFSNFASYDPRVMNNLSAYHNHPYSMFYQPRLNYPGLASQNLTLPPNLMPNLSNLEVNKNLRKNYEIASMMQLNSTVEMKKPSTSVKNSRDSYNDDKSNEKNSDTKTVVKNGSTKNLKAEKVTATIVEKKQETNAVETDDKRVKATTEKSEQKPNLEKANNVANKAKTETSVSEKKQESTEKIEEKQSAKVNAEKNDMKNEKKDEKPKESSDKQKIEDKKSESAKTETTNKT